METAPADTDTEAPPSADAATAASSSGTQNENIAALSLDEVPEFFLPRSIRQFLSAPDNYSDGTGADDDTRNATSTTNGAADYPSYDFDYYNAIVAVETCRALIYGLHNHNRTQYFSLDHDKVNKRTTLANTLQGVFVKLEKKLEAMLQHLESTNRRPLLEKFLDALSATSDEKKIFRLILASEMIPSEMRSSSRSGSSSSRASVAAARVILGGAVGSNTSGSLASTPSPANLSSLLEIPLPKIMALMNPEVRPFFVEVKMILINVSLMIHHPPALHALDLLDFVTQSIWVQEQLYAANVLSESARGAKMNCFSSHTHSVSLQRYLFTLILHHDLFTFVLSFAHALGVAGLRSLHDSVQGIEEYYSAEDTA